MPIHRVYALTDPATGEVRYVGKCKGTAESRLRGHLHEARTGSRNNHRLAWLRGLLAIGSAPGVVELARFGTGEAAIIAERCWIARYRIAGARLVNGTDGGEGMPNPPPEVRAKLRARPQVGFSDEARAVATANRRAKAATPEAQQARRDRADQRNRAKRKRPLPDEEYAEWKRANAVRMGQMNTGIARSPEQRAKIAEGVRRAYAEGRLATRAGAKHTEESRTKMRSAQQRRRREAGDAQ